MSMLKHGKINIDIASRGECCSLSSIDMVVGSIFAPIVVEAICRAAGNGAGQPIRHIERLIASARHRWTRHAYVVYATCPIASVCHNPPERYVGIRWYGVVTQINSFLCQSRYSGHCLQSYKSRTSSCSLCCDISYIKSSIASILMSIPKRNSGVCRAVVVFGHNDIGRVVCVGAGLHIDGLRAAVVVIVTVTAGDMRFNNIGACSCCVREPPCGHVSRRVICRAADTLKTFAVSFGRISSICKSCLGDELLATPIV